MKVIDFLRAAWRESARPILMAIGAAFLLWLASWVPSAVGEAALGPLLTSAALVLGMVAFSHVTRRLFFPKLDLQRIALEAVMGHNVAAGIVFLAICLILAVLIGANVAMIR